MHYVATKICRASEIGYNGNLFGGAMLSWLDEAGAAFAGYLCRTPNMVTLKMDEVRFRRPVKISHHVRIYARIHHLGTSSLTINVEARRFVKHLRAVLRRDAADHRQAAFGYLARLGCAAEEQELLLHLNPCSRAA